MCHLSLPHPASILKSFSLSMADILPGTISFNLLHKTELLEKNGSLRNVIRTWQEPSLYSAALTQERVNIKPNMDKTVVYLSYSFSPKGMFVLSRTRNFLFKIFLVLASGCQQRAGIYLGEWGFHPMRPLVSVGIVKMWTSIHEAFRSLAEPN